MPPFTFNFTLNKPNMEYVSEQEQKVARVEKDTGNICPYPILFTPLQIFSYMKDKIVE